MFGFEWPNGSIHVPKHQALRLHVLALTKGRGQNVPANANKIEKEEHDAAWQMAELAAQPRKAHFRKTKQMSCTRGMKEKL